MKIENFYPVPKYNWQKAMHSVGFEPTRTNTFELESNPLDRSGTDAVDVVFRIDIIKTLPKQFGHPRSAGTTQ